MMATKWSLQGLRAAWLHESSFRLEVYLLVALTPIALWLGHGAIERVLLIGSCLLVLSIELVISAMWAGVPPASVRRVAWSRARARWVDEGFGRARIEVIATFNSLPRE